MNALSIRFAIGCGVATLAAAAHASVAYSFGAITANSINGPATGAAQLSITVDTAGPGLVSFVFANSGPIACFIGNVYWDDAAVPVLTGVSSIANGSGVDMVSGGSPPNLPAGNTVNFAAEYRSKRSGAASTGVDPGESVTYLMGLAAGKSFADVLSALELGGTAGLRVGIHLQGLPDGASESFVNLPSGGRSIPVPSTAALCVPCLIRFGARRRR